MRFLIFSGEYLNNYTSVYQGSAFGILLRQSLSVALGPDAFSHVLMSLVDLPLELLIDVLKYTLYDHPNPADVLCVTRTFHTIGLRVLHANLCFRTVHQLALFSALQELNGRFKLVCAPKTLSISLPGGTASSDVFSMLANVLRCCRAALDEPGARKDAGRGLPLDVLELCLHSHMRTDVQLIYDALSLADPQTFIWTGPDPPHHFSTAIVPAATYQLLLAIRTWPRIAHLKLANLSFPSDPLSTGSRTLGPPLTASTPLLLALPTLRTLSLGQATLLPPGAIAAMLCTYLPGQEGMSALEEVHLVDAYSESIWGPRIRRRDIERAAVAIVRGLNLGKHATERAEVEVLSRVRSVVRCEALTERLMGGDRVEGTTILE
ncbi:hypothetical protein DAEQUDRAFT_185033 [Daedalea quercina L-15889]|uniref:Uncharacterized protein n=1 Tax=Daedalea quercina L-15889 TaxID=1314783 RepID=A0A165KIA1_9APHY|nr:hypothetical protein DAEQUDRAFT_185033 [Daedalea quercina L-15889]